MQISIFDFREEKDLHFTVDERGVSYPTLSPDGEWLAYCVIEAGQMGVYVRSSKGIGKTLKVSQEGGQAPVWARSGKKLFYRSGDFAKMWVVDIQTEGSLTASRPKLLFEKYGLGSSSPQRGYDISLDDRLFLMVKIEDVKPKPVTEMILIQNWFEELKDLVPIEK